MKLGLGTIDRDNSFGSTTCSFLFIDRTKMSVNVYLKKGFKLRTQRPGLPENGPITPTLRMMASRGQSNQSVSPVAYDLVNILYARTFRVGFLHTSGQAIAPWRGWIILDADLNSARQVSSPAVIGQIAHELTHLLQRELKPASYWPSGHFRPSFHHRWIGDSTNYMEVLAYIVGWTVEYDFFLANLGLDRDQPTSLEIVNDYIKTLSSRLAILTNPDIHTGIQLILDMYPDNPIYRQNYLVEQKAPDGRIPPGTWSHWLSTIGFSPATIDHIEQIASH